MLWEVYRCRGDGIAREGDTDRAWGCATDVGNETTTIDRLVIVAIVAHVRVVTAFQA